MRRVNRDPHGRGNAHAKATAGDVHVYYTGNPGEPYNQGAGLGIPDLAKLAGDLG